MKQSFENRHRKLVRPSEVITMAEFVNKNIKRIILARKDTPKHVDMSTIMHAGIKSPVW